LNRVVRMKTGMSDGEMFGARSSLLTHLHSDKARRRAHPKAGSWCELTWLEGDLMKLPKHPPT
jgi:hypothetical protein